MKAKLIVEGREFDLEILDEELQKLVSKPKNVEYEGLNNNSKDVYLRCDDHAECVVFSRHSWKDNDIDYEFTIEDSYCGCDHMGIKSRFKRAWKAFWAKPLCYTGVYCDDGMRMRKFLEDCLSLMEEVGE